MFPKTSRSAPWQTPHVGPPPCRRGSRVAKVFAAGLLATSFLTANFTNANAADGLLSRGDAVVSGFSGIAPSDKPLPLNANPMDHFFIDLEGPAAQIMSLDNLGGAPVGQRVAPTIKRIIKAGEVGQVFAITLDDGRNSKTPNIYLGATSAYGIQIVGPDADGNGAPDRLKTGADGATFMEGQFGPSPEGNPGAIWRIDGTTGKVTLFATLPGNSGPGVGDIVFDKASGQFYASDLDQGLIHRIDQNGILVDSFDHGQNGRTAKGLEPVDDDGSVMNITAPTFNAEDSTTWGYTADERMVYGMAVNGGRLYYAVKAEHQIWSIGLNDDGSFADDARWELDVSNLPGKGPITDITFDASGRMYLAQRGTVKGSYTFAEFTTPEKSEVVRYTRETPNDPATPGVWNSDPDGYPIGVPQPHFSANGGIALGYGHDDFGTLKGGQPGQFLWSTGERLRPSTEDGAENDVHGLQGNSIALTGPDNAPPTSVYFADYDGFFNDAAKTGHTGDIEIWQTAKGKVTKSPPVYVPPFDEPWEEIPPTVNPGYKTNLALTKNRTVKACYDVGLTWRCDYEVRVRNTSLTNWFNGEIRVKDIISNPADVVGVSVPQDGITWSCGGFPAPGTFGCKRHAVLAPGASVSFDLHAFVAKDTKACFLNNSARITHPIGGSWKNTKIVDDADSASIQIPNPDCKPVGDKTNLSIEKTSFADSCFLAGDGNIYCDYLITVRNEGPGLFNHTLAVQDNPTAGTTVEIAPVADWACVPSVGGQECTHTTSPLSLLPTEEVSMWAFVKVPHAVAVDNGCAIQNVARIVTPGAPHPMNTIAGDDVAAAVAIIPEEICRRPETNLTITKAATPDVCTADGSDYRCTWDINVTNTSGNTYKGEIDLDETLPAEPVTAAWNGPWNCVGGGGGGPEAYCFHPYTEIAPGGSVNLTLETTFTVDQVRDNKCQMNNTAVIAFAPGGTVMNTNPGDDTASATAIVPLVDAACAVAVKKAIQCPPGFAPQGDSCKRIKSPTLPPVGPKCRSGWIKFPSKGTIPQGWQSYKATRGGKRIWCAKRPTAPKPGPRCKTGWETFETRSDVPAGWRKYRAKRNGQSVWCGKERKVVLPGPTCKRGYKKFASQYDVPNGWQSYIARKNGKKIWCAKERTVVLPGPKCRTGWKTFYSRSEVPSGWKSYASKKNGKTVWCGKKRKVDLPGPKCRHGYKTFYSPYDVPKGWKSFKATKNGKSVWCGKKRIVDLPGPRCKSGWTKFNSRTSVPKGWKSYSTTRNGKTVWCGKKGKVCRYGYIGKSLRCKPKPQKFCKPGYVGKPPVCVKIKQKKCKWPKVGKWPFCKKPPRQKCPRGYTGYKPNCKKIGGGHGQTTPEIYKKPRKKKNNKLKIKIF